MDRNPVLKRTFDELAAAISDSKVRFDRLTLHLSGRRKALESVSGTPAAPIETIIAPLYSGKQLVGRLHATRGGEPFTIEERECIRTMARIIAAVAFGMSEAAASEERLGEAEVLLDVARATASIHDPFELCRRAVSVIARILPEETQLAIYARSEERSALVPFAWRISDPS